MNAASILRSKTTAIVSAGVLGAGLLGGVAFASVPRTTDTASMTAPDSATAQSTVEAARAKLKAALDALVAKNVITQAQEDAIVSALAAERTAHPKLRDLAGDIYKESVSYLGLPADQVMQQLRAGKSLGDIANVTTGKSRDGLLADLGPINDTVLIRRDPFSRAGTGRILRGVGNECDDLAVPKVADPDATLPVGPGLGHRARF